MPASSAQRLESALPRLTNEHSGPRDRAGMGSLSAWGAGSSIAAPMVEADESDRMQIALDEANAWLEARREVVEWSDEDVEAWDERVTELIALCVR